MYDYNRFDLMLKQRLLSLIEKEEVALLRLQKELNASRGGNLYVKKTKNKTFYTEYSHGKEVGIGHNKDRVHRLARRSYASSTIISPIFLKCRYGLPITSTRNIRTLRSSNPMARLSFGSIWVAWIRRIISPRTAAKSSSTARTATAGTQTSSSPLRKI